MHRYDRGRRFRFLFGQGSRHDEEGTSRAMTTTTMEDREEAAGQRTQESSCVGGEDGRDYNFGDSNDCVLLIMFWAYNLYQYSAFLSA